jgi:hypothetical protein
MQQETTIGFVGKVPPSEILSITDERTGEILVLQSVAARVLVPEVEAILAQLTIAVRRAAAEQGVPPMTRAPLSIVRQTGTDG